MGVPGGPEVSNSVKKTERGPSGVALSVMKYAWDGGVIRIRKAVTRFKEGGSPDEGSLERDSICDVCPQGSAAYSRNFFSNYRECNVLDNHVLVALQYYNANCETGICQVARSRLARYLGNLAENDRGSRRSGFRISVAAYVLVLERTYIYANVNAVKHAHRAERIKIILPEVLGNALQINRTSTVATKVCSYFHPKRLVPHQYLAHSVGCSF